MSNPGTPWEFLGSTGNTSHSSTFKIYNNEGFFALKIILPPSPEQSDPQVVQCPLMWGKSHSNVVKVYEIFSHTWNTAELEGIFSYAGGKNVKKLLKKYGSQTELETMCIRTELCGPSLRYWLNNSITKSEVTFDTAKLQAQIVRDIISGLKFLHSKKIVHGNLTPENILFTRSDIRGDFQLPVKLGDNVFESYGSKSDRIMNEYTAPEIIINYVPSTQSDVYSLGLIICEILENITPLERKAKFLDVKKGIILSIREHPVLNDVPRVIHRATRYSKLNRYQSIYELELALFETMDADKSEKDEDKVLLQSLTSKLTLTTPEPILRESLAPCLHHVIVQFVEKTWYEAIVPMRKMNMETLTSTKYGPNEDQATVLTVLASVYREQNHPQEAVNLLKDVFAIKEHTQGKYNLSVAATLNDLYKMYAACGNYIDAKSSCKTALDILEVILDKNDLKIADQLNRLANMDLLLDKYDEAEMHYNRALKMYSSKLKPFNVRIAKTKNNLASCYVAQEKFKEAEILYKEILTRESERGFGHIEDDHQSVWQIADQIEENETTQDFHFTEELLYHAPQVTKVLQNLAWLYRHQGKVKAAKFIEQQTTITSLDDNNAVNPKFTKTCNDDQNNNATTN
ncbi:Kinesin light chain [Folsomia candida]|uniref:Kinesin light chain n=2 Tax=Folsomia candida TaxID=158441 RepID=A0A226EZW2_FOLCA|nr:Kinesin light chain [Folsomia candida]